MQSIGRFVRLTSTLILIVSFDVLPAQTGLEELQETLRSLDSLVFEQGFNNCVLEQIELLTSEDFEFYHDQSGITTSKSDFVDGIRNNICELTYKPFRQLVKGTLEAFPMKNNGVLYGALQTGIHQFYAREEGKEKYLTSTAKFITLWILEHGMWKMKRIISFDHQ